MAKVNEDDILGIPEEKQTKVEILLKGEGPPMNLPATNGGFPVLESSLRDAVNADFQEAVRISQQIKALSKKKVEMLTTAKTIIESQNAELSKFLKDSGAA
jgi:hypothetical protein